jgi:hypothetical protein
MNRNALFEKLVIQAQKESQPPVDVADDVLAMLTSRRRQTEMVSYRPLVWIASLSSAAAASIAAISYLSIETLTNGAMSGIYELISWVS